jgi:hypothetical protein
VQLQEPSFPVGRRLILQLQEPSFQVERRLILQLKVEIGVVNLTSLD